MTYFISHNPQKINTIINDPAVRPHIDVAGTEGLYVDATDCMDQGAFAILTPDEDGGALCIPDSDGGLEAHTFALPSARGGKVARACMDAANSLLAYGIYDRIYGYTPINNLQAQKFNEKIGFVSKGEIEHDFGTGIPEDVILYEKRTCPQQQ